MPRSGDEARRRLQGAALELWDAHGYDAVTAVQIAARAGVTERTFFRHFPDKQEVLFDGAATLHATIAEALAEARADLPPLRALLHAFRAAEPLLARNRPYSAIRRRIIAGASALQERERTKTALLVAALAAGLGRRGLDPRIAGLAADVGMAAFGHAVTAWIDEPEHALGAQLESSFEQVKALS